jgi:arginyl-tRNA synthetase
MNYLNDIHKALVSLFQSEFSLDTCSKDFNITVCKKEFEGDYTIVLFNWSKKTGKNPESLGQIIGTGLMEKDLIQSFNLIKGFLNFRMKDSWWVNELKNLTSQKIEERSKISKPEKYLIEYCSPNTNKPLHLGHIRNILLGWSVYRILMSVGHEAHTTQIINDRGIAICKSMLAWKLFGEGKTPESQAQKPDHFVGNYYVLFENKFKEEYINWQQSTEAFDIWQSKKKEDETKELFYAKFKNEYFNQYSSLGKAAGEMLRKWESGDEEVIALWKKMNQWVYQGFDETFAKLMVSFESVYYESNTYLLGKDIIKQGLEKEVFYKEKDGSVWIDLTESGLDKKIVLRSDGTSVYITQDLGTAQMRHHEHHADHYIYVVADEQDYHFQVLFETLRKLEEPYSKGMHHLSYGMVELPSGRMKSREGTVVDADDLIAEVINEAGESAMERGELSGISELEKNELIAKIGMSALKYFLLKVHPKKRMIFDPKESVDMQGHTGPYVVNAFVRIKSILRRQEPGLELFPALNVTSGEKDLIGLCLNYPKVLQEAAQQFDPSHLANYLYQMAKDFHRFYHEYRILNAETEAIKLWRLQICKIFSEHLEHGMNCLGIPMPDRM